jgi:hypothetical protein
MDGRFATTKDAANAQLIVTSVNSHQALVEALEKLVAEVLAHNARQDSLGNCIMSVADARAALALAGGNK